MICLVFAIAWYSLGVLIFILYCIKTYNSEVGLYYTIQRILDEWFSTVNSIIFIILLLPGMGAYSLYEKLTGKSS